MIYFFADNHYDAHPGKTIYDNLSDDFKKKITFIEDDFSLLESGEYLKDCELLILNVIGSTCNIPHVSKNAEKYLLEYCKKGGNILLLHGSSAAFWEFDWWREIVGHRWVRGGDPDGVEPSTHPVKPYKLTKVKSRHPLAKKFRDVDMLEDEIYINLEQTAPTMAFLKTTISEGTFVQSYETITKFGGKIAAFIPGHYPAAIANKDLIFNIELLIDYLTLGGK